MIDKKLLQNNFELVVQKLQKKKVNQGLLKELKELSFVVKQKKQQLQNIQSEQNSLSKLFGIYKKENKNIDELKEKIDHLKKQKQLLEEEVRIKEEELNSFLLTIPNIPDDVVPQGDNEEDNVVIEQIGNLPQFDFQPKEHWEIGSNLGILDFERGVKLAKSRFTAISGIGAKLERALINFFIKHNESYGFKEWYVPFMANSKTLIGTGQLPKFKDDLFKIEGEDLYLIPTAEVQLTNLYSNEILKKDDLPLLLTSYTPCFRKEAGSAGRDTRGMIRQHQFDKVELVAITTEDESDEIFDKMVECASSLLTKLNLPHRKVMLCGGDLGFSASKTIDLEVWLPGQNKYREISSISNTRDFQARRAMIRYKDGKKNKLAHTLNGSSLAVGRTLIAIIENYQTKNGDFEIPEVLKQYM